MRTLAQITIKANRLRVAIHAMQLLAGVLFCGAALAQDDDDPDYSRLIFEVAEIPVADAAPTGNAAAQLPGNGPAAASEAALPEASTNVAADIAAYRARIGDTLANDNPYSAALREQYDALGSLLQQAGEHEDAIATFESAMHIDRVNGGLYTLEQIPVVEKMMASHEALGNREEVNDLHEYLFYIKQKTYDEGDPRLLAAMEDYADWNVQSYLREGARYSSLPVFGGGASISTGPMDYVAVQQRNGTFTYIPRSQLMMGAMNPLRNGSLLDPAFASTYGVDADRVIDERLRTARDYYEQIIEKSAAADTTASAADDAELRVQHKLANVAYAVKEQIEGMDTVMDQGSLYYNRALQPRMRPQTVTRGYTRNRDALEAIAVEREQDPAASVIDKAQAWISLGDWHVGFDHGSRSDDAYRKAWELMNAAGMDQAAIDAVFMPEPLMPAPDFVIHEYSRAAYGLSADADIAWRGHMDLTLNVNRYGDVSGVKIDAAVPAETPQVLRSELIDHLRDMKVRPAIQNGETVKREDVKVRYYYSY